MDQTGVKTIKLLEKKIHGNGFGKNFLDVVSKPKETEGKIGKPDNIKIKELCIPGHYLKRQLTE